MARSYPSRRFPKGPYIEPQVSPALRGPKRPGPIGELVPGDDVEVARILARLGRRPLKNPIVYDIKLTGDLEEDRQLVDASELEPFWVFTARRDMALLSLVAVELTCTTASTSGDLEMAIRNITRSEDLVEDIYLIDPATPVIILEDEYSSEMLEESQVSYEINWEQCDVELNDRLGFEFPEIGEGIRGLQLALWFR